MCPTCTDPGWWDLDPRLAVPKSSSCPIIIPTRSDGLATELCLCPCPESLRVVPWAVFLTAFQCWRTLFPSEGFLGSAALISSAQEPNGSPRVFYLLLKQKGNSLGKTTGIRRVIGAPGTPRDSSMSLALICFRLYTSAYPVARRWTQKGPDSHSSNLTTG